jgi:hypothetical protein
MWCQIAIPGPMTKSSATGPTDSPTNAVLDTSVVVCIIRQEPEPTQFLKQYPMRLISIASIVEAGIVLEKQF